MPRATARAGLLWDRSPSISVIGSSKQEHPLAPRAMARAGLLFGCVTCSCIHISAIGSSEQEPYTVPRARARAGLPWDCSPSISAIGSSEKDALHSAPRHGTCWAVGLQPPHQRHRQQRAGALHCARATARAGLLWDHSPSISVIGSSKQEPRLRPAPWHVLGCCLAASLAAASTSAPSAKASRMPCTLPRPTARAGLLFGCVTYCYTYTSAIGSSEQEPHTVPRATARAGLPWDCSPPISAIASSEKDALHSAPRQGTCWAAVELQPLHRRHWQQRARALHCARATARAGLPSACSPPHQRHRQERQGCSAQCPATWHVLG